MNDENQILLETHLNAKNVITNFCNENELDCGLIRDFEDSNKLIKDRVLIEKSQIVDSRAMIKLLKQQLIQASKERDFARNAVYIQRKQLDKHEGNLT